MLLVPAFLRLGRLLGQRLPGGAVGRRVALGQALGHRRGKPHVGEGRHGAGGPPQPAAQLRLGQGELEADGVLCGLAEVRGPADGVVRRVAGQQQQVGFVPPAGCPDGLFPNGQPSRSERQAQKGGNAIHPDHHPPFGPPGRRRHRPEWAG